MKKYVLILAVLTGCLLTGCNDHATEAGMEYMNNSDYSKAISCFEKAVEEEDNVGDAYRGIGLAKWEQKDYEGCLAALEKAIANKADRTAPLYAMMGSCSMCLEDYDSAISYFELAMDLSKEEDPLMQELLRNRIVCYEKSGHLKKAKEYLETYMELYPDDKDAQREVEFLETR